MPFITAAMMSPWKRTADVDGELKAEWLRGHSKLFSPSFAVNFTEGAKLVSEAHQHLFTSLCLHVPSTFPRLSSIGARAHANHLLNWNGFVFAVAMSLMHADAFPRTNTVPTLQGSQEPPKLVERFVPDQSWCCFKPHAYLYGLECFSPSPHAVVYLVALDSRQGVPVVAQIVEYIPSS